MQPTPNNSIRGIYFVNSLIGYAVGNAGVILKTTNGGITYLRNDNSNIPQSFSLSQNYPNPFNPVTKIKFQIPVAPLSFGEGQGVRLVIYDALGREVAVLINEQLSPGKYETEWDASSFPSGVYFYKLTAGDFVDTKKMVLIK